MLLILKLAPILVRGAWKEIKEGVEAPVERTAQLRNGPIYGVERQPYARAILQLETNLVCAV